MPYVLCPACGSSHHLLLKAEALKQWRMEHTKALEAGQTPELPCFYCWKDLKELDVVEVLKAPQDARNVVLGEWGTVVAVLSTAKGGVAYEVDAVATDGSTRWTHTFERDQLKAVAPSRLGDSESSAH